MYRGPNLNANPNMSTVITTASSDRVNEYHGSHPGTLAKGLAGAHFGGKDQITRKNKAVV